MPAVLVTLRCPCLCTEGLVDDGGTVYACAVTPGWTQAWCECDPDDGHLCEHIDALMLVMAGIT